MGLAQISKRLLKIGNFPPKFITEVVTEEVVAIRSVWLSVDRPDPYPPTSHVLFDPQGKTHIGSNLSHCQSFKTKTNMNMKLCPKHCDQYNRVETVNACAKTRNFEPPPRTLDLSFQRAHLFKHFLISD